MEAHGWTRQALQATREVAEKARHAGVLARLDALESQPSPLTAQEELALLEELNMLTDVASSAMPGPEQHAGDQ
ncbi:hypothetical protein [Deinococcus navajonensis]|uniref:Uncharacterized protein n=1 Tax=Deinococcus navajonensis TaxID=309884 RepID=A0ABV8XN40_9DEIO